MTLQSRIRTWLGIEEIRQDAAAIEFSITELRNHQINMQRTLNAIGPGLGRVIAKLDPIVAVSEFDPERKAESDRIGEEVLKRLEAEAKAREPYNQ